MTDTATPTFGDRESPAVRRLRYGLAALLGGSTVLHLLRPDLFVGMIPAWVPGDADAVHAAATAAEGISAGLLLSRRTARLGGWAALLTFLGVFPANVQAAVSGGYPSAPGVLSTQAAAIARLPLQLPLLWWSWRVARDR